MTDKNSKKYTFSDDELDDLLGDIELLAVPENFTNKVLQEIEASDAIAGNTNVAKSAEALAAGLVNSQVSQKSEWWQWVALIGGGIPALLQILDFIFSAWNVASLG